MNNPKLSQYLFWALLPANGFFIIWLGLGGLKAATGFLAPNVPGALFIATLGLPYLIGAIILVWLQYQLYRRSRWAPIPAIPVGIIEYWILLSVVATWLGLQD
ncbi:MAG TPA: hypothetical protein VMT30_06050 [Candidatus Saccharimonadia bacterium]|nr:hypothetical protein [Candidatus Saccharimonadia bacterium]